MQIKIDCKAGTTAEGPAGRVLRQFSKIIHTETRQKTPDNEATWCCVPDAALEILDPNMSGRPLPLGTSYFIGS